MKNITLACPECGGKSFSWLVKEVQFGDMIGDGNGNRTGHGMKRGEVVGSDDEEPFCTTCEKHVDADDLVPAAEVEA